MFFLGEFWYDYDVAGLAWGAGRAWQALACAARRR